MNVANQPMWEERGSSSTKTMLFLLNSKNNNTKKDLRLSYSQGNKLAYPTIVKTMAWYLLTQYPNKTIGHQLDKKGDNNGKKGNDSKPEDKDNNTIGTVGAHIGEVTTPEDSIALNNGSSISAYVLEVAKHKFRPARSVEDLLGVHPINDAIWGRIDPSDVSIDNANSTEIMVCSHIREEQTFTFCRSDPHEFQIWQQTCHVRMIYHGMVDQISWTIPWLEQINKYNWHCKYFLF